jgi:hypothetical protein
VKITEQDVYVDYIYPSVYSYLSHRPCRQYACETPGLPHFLDNRLTDGGEVVSLRAGRALLPGTFLVLISARG